MERKPLYLQIKESLGEQVTNGLLQPGDRIPTELELCEQFRTTRLTVRRAIDELIDEHILVGMGRKGTFVSKAAWERHLNRFQSSFEDLVSRGLSPVTQVLRTEVISAPAEQAKVLQLASGEQVAYIERLRFVEDEPFSLLFDWLPLDLYRPLLGNDLTNQSLYSLVEQKAGCRISSARQTIGVKKLTPHQAKLLGVPPTHHALEMDVVCYNDLGGPQLVGRYLFRADRYRMTVTLRR
jgi:GntR family transcriptional regulator